LGIKTALPLLKTLPDWHGKQSVFSMEQSGIYNTHLLDFLHKLHLPICLQIKKAGGLQGGKTHAIDAQGIAEYAYRLGDQIRLWQPPRELVQQLALLSATPQRLILVYNQLAVPLKLYQS
jgi:transposase